MTDYISKHVVFAVEKKKSFFVIICEKMQTNWSKFSLLLFAG